MTTTTEQLEANKKIARDYIDQVFNQHNPGKAADFVTSDVVWHGNSLGHRHLPDHRRQDQRGMGRRRHRDHHDPGRCLHPAVGCLTAPSAARPAGLPAGRGLLVNRTARAALLESVLTIVGGKIVWSSAEFEGLAAPLPAPAPAWSPVTEFGGFRNPAFGVG